CFTGEPDSQLATRPNAHKTPATLSRLVNQLSQLEKRALDSLAAKLCLRWHKATGGACMA
ncbi:MAG: hypothetical protein ACK53L_06105, partial [Pirellulaceae bacterium]